MKRGRYAARQTLKIEIQKQKCDRKKEKKDKDMGEEEKE